jgi:hypothetical protein
VLEAGGRGALTVAGSTAGSVTLWKSSPFPTLSLGLRGEFSLADPSDSISVETSIDGTSWTDPIPIPVNSGAPSAEYSVDLSQYVVGSNSVYVRLLLNGSAGGVQVFNLDLQTEAQLSQKMFPQLQAGKVNALSYEDQSPATQARAIQVELAIPTGEGELPIQAIESVIPADPPNGIPHNHGGRDPIDALASPHNQAASKIDYVVTLQRRSHVNQVSVWWGMYGTNPGFLSSWTLYGRDGNSSPWVVISAGGFPNAPVSDIPVSASVTDLRMTADSGDVVGLYRTEAYGNEMDPPLPPGTLTASSQLPENPTNALLSGAAKLVDGDPLTLASPGGPNIDYVVSLGGLSHVSGATITWGGFGIKRYVNSWSLYGRDTSGNWNLLSSGGFPGSDKTTVQLDAFLTDIRIAASSTEAPIGIYEVRIDASQALTLSDVTSNVPVSSVYGYPSANLTDGNVDTLAYPGAPEVDYQVDLGKRTLVDGADINWGYFGTNSIYVQSWEILGKQYQNTTWTSVAHGGFPNSAETWAAVGREFDQLRVRAVSPNWIGIYELTVYGRTFSALSATVPLSH